MAVYEIRVRGHLDGHWSEWFDGLAIANVEDGDAILSGEIVDQSALHGVLNEAVLEEVLFETKVAPHPSGLSSSTEGL